MIFGYARVSTTEQSLDSQFDALRQAGARRIFKEKILGAAKERPQLHRLIEQPATTTLSWSPSMTAWRDRSAI